jgi:membrane-associated protease RseP (regulator of RpoE activity)
LDPELVWDRHFGVRSRLREWAVPALLFFLTLLSTLFCGGSFGGESRSLAETMVHGIPFAVPLLMILLSHEFGHYFAAMAHGVPASPPYFIPLPLFTGTMGAVIRMRGPMPTRRALVDIGAAGPIAGFVVAVPFLVWGLAHSHVVAAKVPIDPWPPLAPLTWLRHWQSGLPILSSPSGVLEEGSSLLYSGVRRLTFGPLSATQDVEIHPTAFAAWFGLFVTTLNLLPIGQLDGGHVLYAVLGERARTIGRVVLMILVVLGLTCWLGWLVWALIGWRLIRTTHPPVQNTEEPLDGARRLTGWVSLAIFLVTFLPVPFAVY